MPFNPLINLSSYMSINRMPYKLVKAKNQDLYFVVNKFTNKHYSINPLPLHQAQKQLRALYTHTRQEM